LSELAEAPLITVAIPVYNEAEAIIRCICSVEAQTCNLSREILVIDDGSTDGTLDILHQLNERFGDLRILSNGANRGRPYTRGRLIEEARGKYYAMLDADDSWYASKLDRQLALMADQGDDETLMICGNLYHNDLDDPKQCRAKDFAKGYATYSVARLLKGDNIPISQLCLCHTSFLRRLGGFDERLSRAQDWDFLIRFFLAGGRVTFVPGEPLAQFNYQRKGRNWREIMACMQLVIAKHINAYEANQVDPEATLETIRSGYVKEFTKVVAPAPAATSAAPVVKK
jgi:glycosyltransferase involved in cell wall biosynthesis